MKDDLISRQVAIKALEETKQSDPFDRYEYQNIGIDWGIDAIKALPPAQPDVSDTNVGKICEYYDLCRNGRDEKKLREELLSAQPGWTYIEEELPKTIINKHTHDFQEYNCLCDFDEYGFDVRTYKFGNGHFWNGGGIVDKYVTAWQPLPEIPDALKQKQWEGEQ